MAKVNFDVEDLMTLDDKKKLLKELKQEDLISAFASYKPTYQPKSVKKNPLDQLITLGITADEKTSLQGEIKAIKQTGTPTTISAYVRSRATSEIDINAWAENAMKGLKDLNTDKYDRKKLTADQKRLMLLIESLPEDDEETLFVSNRELKQVEDWLEELKRPTIRRGFRLSGRVTFEEANVIRWRAAKLMLTVADYMRFLIFDHKPFTEADRHLSLDAKKRFYVSVIDVARNGWGTPPQMENCANCARLRSDNEALRNKIKRFETFGK